MSWLRVQLAAVVCGAALSATAQPLYKVYPIPGPNGNFDISLRSLNENNTFVGSGNVGNLYFKGSRANGYTILQPPSGMANYQTNNINDGGWVSGGAYDLAISKPVACIWNPANVPTVVGRLPGMDYGIATDMNSFGQVCGNSGNNNIATGFRWSQAGSNR